MNQMNIYAAGGAGINIVSQLMRHADKPSDGFATFRPVFIDTSASNFKRANLDINDERVYLIEDRDGSGKKRDSNAGAIAERSKEILHRYKPGDLNVIVHSASGGSGSVIGPIIAGELLKKDVQTIVITIGSTDSRIEVENTSKTLKGYEATARKIEKPVNMVYYENSSSTPRGSVDQKVQTIIVLLAAIFSGQNHELDSADLSNFLNYQKVTAVDPQLTHLEFYSKTVELARGHSVVSAVSISDAQTDASIGIPVGYRATGYIDDKLKDAITVDLPLHIVTVAGYFPSVLERLTKVIKDIDEHVTSAVTKRIQLDEELNEHGLIL
jgi:hypothetical protein